jgi:apolipoprotein N-acyltransferase
MGLYRGADLTTGTINNGGASGTLGIEDRARSLKTKKHSFAPLICYESIYGEFNAEQCRQGADFIAVITNDGWWEDTPGYKQHMSFCRIRAIENRRSVARSANTGISCFINQRGDVIQQTKWWEPAALRSNINKNKHLTFYTKRGDVLGRTSFIATVLLIGLWIFKSLRGRKAKKN